MASNFYRAKDGPRYILGHSLELGFICLGMVATVVLILTYSKINKSRDRELASIDESTLSPEELSFKGDRAVTFRYML